MRGKTGYAAAVLGMSLSLFLSGCSFSSAMEKVVDVVTDSDADADAAAQAPVDETFAAYVIDESIAAPEFAVNPEVKTSVTKDAAVALQAIATSPDGGLISYQWYRNNVNSNGGGTAIQGAVGDTYAPPTDAKGTWFYYAVAVSTKGGKANMSTSTVAEVSVWDNMYWQQNADNGGYQYICRDDGKYPTDASIMIDGTLYLFNSEGFVVDEGGKMFDVATGQPIITQTEEQPAADAEEQPAQDAAEQPAGEGGEQPAEETAEQPAEDAGGEGTE